jgi:hypothetical protein
LSQDVLQGYGCGSDEGTTNTITNSGSADDDSPSSKTSKNTCIPGSAIRVIKHKNHIQHQLVMLSYKLQGLAQELLEAVCADGTSGVGTLSWVHNIGTVLNGRSSRKCSGALFRSQPAQSLGQIRSRQSGARAQSGRSIVIHVSESSRGNVGYFGHGPKPSFQVEQHNNLGGTCCLSRRIWCRYPVAKRNAAFYITIRCGFVCNY